MGLLGVQESYVIIRFETTRREGRAMAEVDDRKTRRGSCPRLKAQPPSMAQGRDPESESPLHAVWLDIRVCTLPKLARCLALTRAVVVFNSKSSRLNPLRRAYRLFALELPGHLFRLGTDA